MTPTNPLQTVVSDQLWHAQAPVAFGPFRIHTRMTVVRLPDGGLWVHSPIAPAADLMATLADLGPVRYVVAPNRSHHLFLAPFLVACPHAQGFLAPGLADKRPDLGHLPTLPTPASWDPVLTGFPIAGLPVLNETVWFHSDTGTLILTDLLFCIGDSVAGLGGLVASLLGVRGRLAMSRSMKLLIQDRQALARSVAPLLQLPVQRVIVAHDEIVSTDAASALARAFAFLPAVSPADT